MPHSKLHANSPTHSKSYTMPTHCRNCLTTNFVHYISSALSFLPLLRGWTTVHHRHHPRHPLLPLNHATTCVLDLTLQLPSPTPIWASLWNTETTLQIPPPATSGSAPLPTNLDDLPKASPTITSTPPTPSSSSPSRKSHATNAPPMHDLSAVFARRNLNHIAPASPLVVI